MEVYLSVLQEIAQQFDKFELTKIPRGDNTSADALAALAATSNPAVKRIIPVEGIDKPSINLPCKGIDLKENSPHALMQSLREVGHGEKARVSTTKTATSPTVNRPQAHPASGPEEQRLPQLSLKRPSMKPATRHTKPSRRS